MIMMMDSGMNISNKNMNTIYPTIAHQQVDNFLSIEL